MLTTHLHLVSRTKMVELILLPPYIQMKHMGKLHLPFTFIKIIKWMQQWLVVVWLKSVLILVYLLKIAKSSF
jgi:hypothetical protein